MLEFFHTYVLFFLRYGKTVLEFIILFFNSYIAVIIIVVRTPFFQMLDPLRANMYSVHDIIIARFFIILIQEYRDPVRN